MLTENQAVQLLKQDVVPSLGCTEPVCVALCAANAAKLTTGAVRSVSVRVNGGIYKNGMSAGIPGCSHVGLTYAAAIGACLRNPEKKLELLEDLTPEILREAEKLCDDGQVVVTLAQEEHSLYAECTVRTDSEEGLCEIRGDHTNVTSLKKNGAEMFNAARPAHQAMQQNGGPSLVDGLTGMTMAQIVNLVNRIPEEDLLFLLDGVEMNEQLAAYGEREKRGVGIADAFEQEMMSGRLLNAGLTERIILKVSAAAESRLDGCPLPAMSSSGAGTKGLAVILPVSETADALGVSREKKVRAIALSHLINCCINACIGKLSPMCTCVMASSTAASAGITYLLGGTDDQIGYAIRNMAGTVTGMICDGGKVGCSLKVASGSVSALLCALSAIHNAPLRVTDGICGQTPEACIRNMARIGHEGMKDTDSVIVRIMSDKKEQLV